jgi:mannose-1-phosphate guanylyltransferase/phosphomannomutase
MKALVLCAGLGTRLGEMTRSIPKPMLTAGGHPLLEYTLTNLARHGFDEILINLHFMPEMISDYFGDGSPWGVRLTYVHEPQLLGTAGSVANAAPSLASQGTFLVHYGDVVTDQDFSAMLGFHQEQRAEATLLVHQRAKSNSVLVLDEQRRIQRFVERPTDAERLAAASPWVFSGAMICEPTFVGHIDSEAASDLARDVFPRLAGTEQLLAYALTGVRFAVDSTDRLREADAAIANKMLRVRLPPRMPLQ